ncbi:MAG: CDP-alcohol phosphatidyltransferase family protein [Opitutaceae bacterium]
MSDAYPELERRPLTTRRLAVSKALAGVIAASGITPNAISVAGLVFGVLAGVSLALTAHAPVPIWYWLGGALLIQLRLLANMFDGMVALETGKHSRVGELFNEVPDRVSDAAILIGLGYAAGSSPAAGYVAACVSLFVAYVRAMGKAAGAPQDFCGPMAKPQRMFFATAVSLWCGLCPAAWLTWGGVGAPVWVLGLIVVGGAFTAVRRLIRVGRALRGGEEAGR